MVRTMDLIVLVYASSLTIQNAEMLIDARGIITLPPCTQWEPGPRCAASSFTLTAIAPGRPLGYIVVGEPTPNRMTPTAREILDLTEWVFDPLDLNHDGRRSEADLAALRATRHDWNLDGAYSARDEQDLARAIGPSLPPVLAPDLDCNRDGLLSTLDLRERRRRRTDWSGDGVYRYRDDDYAYTVQLREALRIQAEVDRLRKAVDRAADPIQ